MSRLRSGGPWLGRWYGTKFGLVAGCVGSLLHLVRGLGWVDGGSGVSLPVAIPVELFITTSAGFIVDLFRPIRSRLHAMGTGMLAALPGMTVGAWVFDRALSLATIGTILGGAALLGGLSGAIIYFRLDEV